MRSGSVNLVAASSRVIHLNDGSRERWKAVDDTANVQSGKGVEIVQSESAMQQWASWK